VNTRPETEIDELLVDLFLVRIESDGIELP
jgi:hypothetical protein